MCSKLTLLTRAVATEFIREAEFFNLVLILSSTYFVDNIFELKSCLNYLSCFPGCAILRGSAAKVLEGFKPKKIR